MEELGAALKVYVGYIGATIAAWFGILVRQAYHPDGFKWRRVLLDAPFAVFCAILAGAAGEYFQLPAQVIYGISGAIGFLSPLFLSDFLERLARRKLGGDDDGSRED